MFQREPFEIPGGKLPELTGGTSRSSWGNFLKFREELFGVPVATPQSSGVSFPKLSRISADSRQELVSKDHFSATFSIKIRIFSEISSNTYENAFRKTQLVAKIFLRRSPIHLQIFFISFFEFSSSSLDELPKTTLNLEKFVRSSSLFNISQKIIKFPKFIHEFSRTTSEGLARTTQLKKSPKVLKKCPSSFP